MDLRISYWLYIDGTLEERFDDVEKAKHAAMSRVLAGKRVCIKSLSPLVAGTVDYWDRTLHAWVHEPSAPQFRPEVMP